MTIVSLLRIEANPKQLLTGSFAAVCKSLGLALKHCDKDVKVRFRVSCRKCSSREH